MIQAKIGKRIIATISLFIAISYCCILLAGAASITKAEKKAYLNLGELIPQDAAFILLASNVPNSLDALDSILKKYETTDPSFDYNKFILSIKGGLGYNPFSKTDLAATGLDLEFGLGAYSKTRDGVPMLVFKAKDTPAVKALFGNLAAQLVQAKPCPPEKIGKTAVDFFTPDGTLNSPIAMAVATKGDVTYVMADPPSKDWFVQHLNMAVKLNKNKSLAGDRTFKKLLGRLETPVSVITYNNYAKYVAELKSGTKLLKEQVRQMGALDAPLNLLDELAVFAEGFTGQLFAISVQNTGVGFVHELIGPPKKVKQFRSFFPTSKKDNVKLDIYGNPIGILFGKMDAPALLAHLKKNPDFNQSWEEAHNLLLKESGLNLEEDVVNSVQNTYAMAFYGMGTLPEEIVGGRGMTGQQMMSLAKIVVAVNVKDPNKVSAILKKAEEKLSASGKEVKELRMKGGSRFVEVIADGLPLQYGVHKNTFLIGIGRGAIDAALSDTPELNLSSSQNAVGHLKFDFRAFAESMENLKPPVDSPNTQLHQQYKVWAEQVRNKLVFIHSTEFTSTQTSDGYRTVGTVNF